MWLWWGTFDEASQNVDPWFVSCSWFYFIGAFSPVAFTTLSISNDGLDCLHFTESPSYGLGRPGRWHSFSSHTHALAMRASWTVACTLHTHSLLFRSDLCNLPLGALTAATRVQRAQVIDAHFTRVWSQHATLSTHNPPTYMSHV
jgi:hypothetical protein